METENVRFSIVFIILDKVFQDLFGITQIKFTFAPTTGLNKENICIGH